MNLRLAPSRLLAALIAAGHGGAALFALAAGLPAWSWAALLAALALSARHHLRRSAWRSHPLAVTGLRLRLDGRCEWLSGGAWTEGRLDPARFVSPLMAVLMLREENGRRVVVAVAHDALPADDHRRLRVLLRWAGTPE